MLRQFQEINIQQIPTEKWPNRNLNFTLDFVTDYKIESDWESHVNPCVIKFPKNIKLFGTEDGIFTYSPTHNVILGGSGTDKAANIDARGQLITEAPLIMKGDIVTINHGEICRNANDQDFYISTGGIGSNLGIPKNQDLSNDDNLFFGYVSSVNSCTPIEINCEDNFYLLKRTPFDKTVWNKKESDGNTSLYKLMQHILDLVNSKFNEKNGLYPKLNLLNVPSSITAQFSLGYLEIGDMTCAQLLEKLKQQYHFFSTFRENTLQFGFPIYIDNQDAPANLQSNSKNFFCFRDIFNSSGILQASANIFPTHDLEYSNKDDIELSATVQCKVINKVVGKSTLSGKQKTKVERLKVFVYWDIITNSFKSIDLSSPGSKIPLSKGEGERHQFFYPVDNSNPNPKLSDLVELGKAQLERYHFTGFRGCFTTFGFPFVQWNDNINLLDPIYSDRNGQYKVKKVIYRGGLKGLSQEPYLDYKINVPEIKDVKSYYLL